MKEMDGSRILRRLRLTWDFRQFRSPLQARGITVTLLAHEEE